MQLQVKCEDVLFDKVKCIFEGKYRFGAGRARAQRLLRPHTAEARLRA
jgi:hypothetical protein